MSEENQPPNPETEQIQEPNPHDEAQPSTWNRMISGEMVLKKPIAFAIAAAAVIAILVCSGGFYAIGRNQAVEGVVLTENLQENAKFQSLSKQVQDKQIELNQANGTIAEASGAQEQLTDLQQQINDAKSQLESLNGQVANAQKTSASDGVWQVGTDIDPGTYRANSPVPEDCYWSITNGGEIVQNDLPNGGYPQVTVSPGQQLKLQSCGTWTKQ